MYGEYGRLVYAVAYKTLGDRELAEEATQQAFVQAWRASGSYDPAREMGSWLATIARRAAGTAVVTDKGLPGEDFGEFFTSKDLGLVLIRPAATTRRPRGRSRTGCGNASRPSSERSGP